MEYLTGTLHHLCLASQMKPGRMLQPSCCEASSISSASCLVVRQRGMKGGLEAEERYMIFLGDCRVANNEVMVSLFTCSQVPGPPGAVPLVIEVSNSVPMVCTTMSAELICSINFCGARMSPTSQSISAFSGQECLRPFLLMAITVAFCWTSLDAKQLPTQPLPPRTRIFLPTKLIYNLEQKDLIRENYKVENLRRQQEYA